ncbi:[FeFe] hydrogenase, group A [Jutongia huaianensis]|uniref:(2Fe-2S)-binding protein n=1 Tax=Jutongia huaianensis TaxID=2763668 RepID=A0ABR7MZK0_9FIRM|nr:[FeFe] hydrogenase, group A [Jutongia huaianensis]MBC8561809.1 (2Fe-2S)-binding protein [Jutongia huaianensis]
MSEKYMIIDGIRTAFTDEKNILQVIRKAGIHVPTFCYYTDMSIYGACRMCVVEDERGSIIASCSTPPKDKMVIRTNTSKLHQHRKMILELLLASHCRDCTICEKNGNCRLQMLAARFHLTKVRFPNTHPEPVIDDSSLSIVRDPSKCILCGDCVRMCNEVQHVGAIDFAHRGANMIVSPAFGRPIAETDCVNCGQCAAVCPTAAITIKKDLKGVWQALYAPNKRVVVQIAPAVRVAIGEEFGIAPGKNTIGKIYTALRMLGFDTVFDTSFSADLTVIEEANELVYKLENGEKKYPQGNTMPLFTSCCPAWVRFVETKYPELLPYVSTCKSPMEMFGAVLKEYYKPADAEAGMETISVAVMPCVAKKYEAARDEFCRNGVPDVDYVITTKELILMIKELGVQFQEIEPSAPDMPFSINSGAGVIFGVTGGVMEAALRHVAAKNNETLREIEYSGVRGLEGTKIAEISLGDKTLRVGVVNGLGNADTLIRKLQRGEEKLDFVEVMACPYGCIGGAGQPFGYRSVKEDRAQGMYKADKSAIVKRSCDNPTLINLYENGILKERSHELLHVHYGK